jgi:hypothetical protein
MTEFNPITTGILQTPGVQRLQSADKALQLRQAQERERNGSAAEDVPETVPGAEELSAVGDKHQNPGKRKKPYTAKQGPHDDEPEEGSQLDLRA